MFPWWTGPPTTSPDGIPDTRRMCWADITVQGVATGSTCNAETESVLGLCEDHLREVVGDKETAA